MASGLAEIDIGNDCFVNEDYQGALAAYSRGLDAHPQHADLLARRAACHIKLKDFAAAEADASAAVAADAGHVQGHLRLGMALYSLQQYGRAKDAFERGLSLASDPASKANFSDWLGKTVAELPVDAATPSSSSPSPSPSSTGAELLPLSTYRRDWYQSPSHVTIDLFARDTQADQLSVAVTSGSHFELRLRVDRRSEYHLSLELCEPVVADSIKVAHYKSKIEIRLEKTRPSHWKTLEASADVPIRATDWFAGDFNAPPPSHFPTSHREKKDWEKIASSFEEDKLTGDAALNKVFQDIYSKGSEEQRRAMIKSFTESGGTVLSTNWQDVGARKVEVSPPKGLEAKSWSDS